jgi:hypothetical protein
VAGHLPGDIVSRRKGFVMHKGLVLRDGRILHNTPFHGEHVCSEEEFRAGKRLHVSRQSMEARQRALRAAGNHQSRSYNLLTNNCEHTVTRVAHGEARSPQLVSWVTGLAVASVAFALTRHPTVTAAGYAIGRSLGSRVVNQSGGRGAA